MRTAPKGMTLIEVLMSLAIVAVVMGAASSVLTFTARALPSGETGDESRTRMNQALAQFAQEVSEATQLVALTSDSIEFRVADRTNDGVAEVVRYEFGASGVASLRRTFNGLVSGELLTAVASFNLEPTTMVRERTIVGPGAWSAEKLLYSFDGTTDGQVSVGTGAGYTPVLGQVVLPVLEEQVTEWSVSRIEVPLLRIVSLTPQVAFEVRRITGSDEPSLIPGSSVNIDASSSNKLTPTWFSGTIPLFVSYPRNAPVAIMVRPQSSVTQGIAVPKASEVAGDVTHLCIWNIMSWSTGKNEGIPCKVWGKTFAPTRVQESWSAVTGIGISLALQNGERTVTSVRLLNEPEEP